MDVGGEVAVAELPGEGQRVVPHRLQGGAVEPLGLVRLGNAWLVRPDDDLLQRLRDQYGTAKVRLVY